MDVVGLRPRLAAWMIASACLSWAGAATASPGNTPLGPCSATADVQADALACSGYIAGNDDVAEVSALALTWGLTDTLTQYKDNLVAPGAGSENALFDVVQGAGDASTGALTLLGEISGPFVLTLKGGNEWAAYYFGGPVHVGDTITFDIPGTRGAGLSHASVYAAAASVDTGSSDTASNGVPEPSPLAAALPGLAAIVWVARRRRRG